MICAQVPRRRFVRAERLLGPCSTDPSSARAVLGPKRADALEVEGRKGESESLGARPSDRLRSGTERAAGVVLGLLGMWLVLDAAL